MTNKIKSNFHVCSPNAFILSFSAHYSNRVIHNSNIISYKKEGPTALLVLKLDYFITKPTAEPRRTGDKRTYVSIFG